MDKHRVFMQRAIELAEKARGRCSPNPFVGAVIVRDGKVIGEGWTQVYGSDHAEVQAIKQCREGCTGAELYVTLEPCSHFGKTPPCARAVIESGIKAVYIGIEDPSPLVSGKGIAMLEAAGIKVRSGILVEAITHQLEYHITYVTKKRPFVFLKSAISLDGRIAAADGSARWISCVESRQKTHELRQEADAVITGIGTILKDDPLLNVRLANPYKQPLRVVLDPCLELPLESQLAHTAKDYKTLVCYDNKVSNPTKESALTALGIELIRVKGNGKQLNLDEVMALLYTKKIQVLMLEAGATLNTSFLQAHLVDKLYVFIAPKLLGGTKLGWQDIGIGGIKQALPLKDMRFTSSGVDVMVTAYPDYDRTAQATAESD